MSQDDTRFVDFYDLLGVPPTAGADEIRTAIKDKRRTWNPRQNHPEPKTRSHAEQVMRDLDAAERTLLDVGRRAGYDAERPVRLGQAEAAATAQVGDRDDWEDRARYFLDNDNPVAAHRVAQEAVTRAPGSPVAWTLRGQSSALLGNFADAEYELAEACRLAPAEGFPVYLLGEVYAAQEKWQYALKQYDRALGIDPGNPVYGTSKARLFLANDKPDLAVKIMEPIVDQFPDDVYTYHLAMAYHDAAIAELPQLPDGSHIWTSEEHIMALEEAAECIEQLGNTDPDVRETVTELRSFASRGREVHWDTAAPNLYVGLGVAIFVFSCAGCFNITESFGASIFLGLIVSVGAAGAIFAAVRRKPAWKLAQQALGKGNLTQRMQDLGNRAGLVAGRFLQ